MDLLMHGVHQYRMDTLPRGLCLIINNRDFKKEKGRGKGKGLEPREGTDKDRDALKATFEELLFEVRCHDNLTDKEMTRALTTVAGEDHAEHDCFACCILTYGDPGGALLGVNCHAVKVRSLLAALKTQHCASLEGKPKVFFVQACPANSTSSAASAAAASAATSSSGGGVGEGVVGSSGDDCGKSPSLAGATVAPAKECMQYIALGLSVNVNVTPAFGLLPRTGLGGGGAGGKEGWDKEVKLLPNETDFVLGYCAKPAFTSPAARQNGSLYIQKMVKLLTKYGHSHDILEILTKLNEAVNEHGGGQGGDFLSPSPSAPRQPRQDPAFTKDTLRMKLRLAPSPKVQTVRMLIMGKSKRGKSSTANTIAGRDLFSVNSSFGQNLFTTWHTVAREGRTIEITEMPTELDSEEAVRPLIAATPGPHVILLCFRCDQFFSPDDYYSFTTIKKWLGKHVSKP
ncbi:hypothetical protein ACOMHN_023680 [Nucella lapillus]